MIETKEQYEYLRKKHVDPFKEIHHEGLDNLFETIEALRRFVRAHDAVEQGTVSFDLHHEQVQELRDSRAALPDWIKDG